MSLPNCEIVLDAIRELKQAKAKATLNALCERIIAQQNGVTDRDSAARIVKATEEAELIYNISRKSEPPAYILLEGTAARKVDKDSNLTRLVVKAVKVLGNESGLKEKRIRKFVAKVFKLEVTDGSNVKVLVKKALDEAVKMSFLECSENLYKLGSVPVAKRKQSQESDGTSDQGTCLKCTNEPSTSSRFCGCLLKQHLSFCAKMHAKTKDTEFEAKWKQLHEIVLNERNT